MPLICIPQTGTTINWVSTDAGRIRINGWLNLSDRQERKIGIELSFKREPFQRLFRRSNFWWWLRGLAERETQAASPLTSEEQEALDRFRSQLWEMRIDRLPPDLLLREWGHAITSTLQQDSYADALRRNVLRGHRPLKRPSRKSLQTLNGSFQGIDYRLTIDYDNLKSLRNVIATEAGASRLSFEVQWYLLPTSLIDYALKKLPRGRPQIHFQQNVKNVAQCAVYVAMQLIAAARENQDLRTRLGKALSSEHCEGGFRENVKAMVLADRALRPALEKAGLAILEGRNPSDLLDPESTRQLADMFNNLPEKLTWWFDLLLGSEGHAARTLKLV